MVGDPPTHYADSDGVNIAYQVHGDGELDLVFVPGFVSHVELLWESPAVARFLRRLASFSRVVIFDKRGQGLSDRPGSPPTLEESMDDLRAVLEAASCKRPAIFGISEGGPMSTLFAATYPERISSLVLYGTYARMVRSPDFSLGIPGKVLDRWGEIVRQEWGGPVGLRYWAPSVVGDPESERWWSRLLRQGTSPAGAIALIDLYREMDVRAILPSINVPALVLHRADDRVVKVGSRRAREPERALATVLFTDIVGSTEAAARLGDRRWRDLLERHDAIVRRQLAIHRGREVKTMGDGFLATFDGPARAIRCATAIDQAVSGIGIEVRTGIHTGEVDLVGDDIGGMAVNICARIGALADSREVLVSSTVRELVVGSGLDFAERGTHILKGAPDQWRLFAVV